MEPSETLVKNCYISRTARDLAEERAIFYSSDAHGVQCRLDGYAIIPMDEYARLKALSSDVPFSMGARD